MTAEPQEPGVPAPPRWLTKAEKFAFRRICDARHDAGRPVSATETDTIADYCSSRTRLGDLRRLYRSALAEAKATAFVADQKHAAALARQLDQATAAAQRMARRLGLGGEA